MNFENKHPAEIQFQHMLEEVRKFIDKYEDRYLEGEEKQALHEALNHINERLSDLQSERFRQYINEWGKVENMPKEEEMIQREMTDLYIRINKILTEK